MGNIGPMRQRFEVLALPAIDLGNLDLLTVRPRVLAVPPKSRPESSPQPGPDPRAG